MISEFGQTPSQLFDASQRHPPRQHITPLLHSPLPGYLERPSDGDAVPAALEHVLQAASAMDPFEPGAPAEPQPALAIAEPPSKSVPQAGAAPVASSARALHEQRASEPAQAADGPGPEQQAAPAAGAAFMRAMFGGSRKNSQNGFTDKPMAPGVRLQGADGGQHEPHVTAMKAHSMQGWLEVTTGADSLGHAGASRAASKAAGTHTPQASAEAAASDLPLAATEPGPVEDPAESECPLVAPPMANGTSQASAIPVAVPPHEPFSQAGEQDTAAAHRAVADSQRSTAAADSAAACTRSGSLDGIQRADRGSSQPSRVQGDPADGSSRHRTGHCWPPNLHKRLKARSAAPVHCAACCIVTCGCP